MDDPTSGPAALTRDALLAELLLERYGPRPLPPAAPPHPVQQAITARTSPPAAPPPLPRRRGHLRVLDGRPTSATAA